MQEWIMNMSESMRWSQGKGLQILRYNLIVQQKYSISQEEEDGRRTMLQLLH